MDIIESIQYLDSNIKDPKTGLPEAIFEFVSSVTPLINVDVIIRNYENNKTLMSWREDPYSGSGWHVPGSIIRFQEEVKDRLRRLLKEEIGTEQIHNLTLITITQMIIPENTIRGHFFSILYSCNTSDRFIIDNGTKKEGDNGYLKWHSSAPENIIKVHEVYKTYINEAKRNQNVPFNFDETSFSSK